MFIFFQFPTFYILIHISQNHPIDKVQLQQGQKCFIIIVTWMEVQRKALFYILCKQIIFTIYRYNQFKLEYKWMWRFVTPHQITFAFGSVLDIWQEMHSRF